ncbi:hypothetical protein AB6C98_12325, partial [Vibrio splendidus]
KYAKRGSSIFKFNYATKPSFVALSMYVIAANKLSVLLMKEKVSKAFNRATGGIFIGFGLSLIASNKA